MMGVQRCDAVRGELTAYHDGELSIEEQVRIQSHLQECIACRIEAASLAELGDALRDMASSPARTAAASDSGRIVNAVLDRIRVERQFSLGAQLRELFEDMHLVWAGLGATMAMMICFFASAGVLQAASQEKPESLAAIISTLANQGTNDHPLRLAGSMLAPRALMDAPMPTTGEDGEWALSAVVTREGRIQNLEMLTAQNLEVLTAEQALALQARPEVVLGMLDAASRARFHPAISGGSPVAVNVVWLVTSTTVKGRPDYDLYLLRPPRATGPVHGPAAPAKRPAPEPVPAKVPTAGGEEISA